MRWWLACLLVVIIGAHLALWSSDIPRALAWRLTAINAAAWAVILLPAYAVGKWAAAHQRRTKQGAPLLQRGDIG